MKNYFSKSKEEVLQELQVTENGLNSQEVKERVKKYGELPFGMTMRQVHHS